MSSGPSNWELPTLEISAEIQDFKIIRKDNRQQHTIEAVADIADQLKTENRTAVLLATLGWNSIGGNTEIDPESQTPIVILGCQMCFSTMEIQLKSLNRESTSHPPKRQKRLARYCNPHDAHRHYCPLRCGFPTNVLSSDTPLWQVLLLRLVAQQEKHIETATTSSCHGPASSEAVFDSVAKIRKILMSGIVPKKVELPVEEEDEN